MLAAIVLFFSLGLDTLAVAISLGLSGLPRGKWLRVGLVFAFFEGLMPIIGILVGRQLSHSFALWAAYAAAGLLILLGGREIKEFLLDDDDAPPSVEGGKLILAGLSVSLDELAVGFSLGVLHIALGPALAFIAVQALVVTFAGLSWGVRVGEKLGKKAELIAGIILVLLGITLIINQVAGNRLYRLNL